MQICFATCAKRPQITDDDAILARAFEALGVAVLSRPWDEIAPATDAIPILLRSTWDYHRHPTRFAAWITAVSESGTLLLNPAATVLGNIDKGYLRILEQLGFPIPRTRWLDRTDPTRVIATLHEEGWEQAVLKPRIGATSHGTILVRTAEKLTDEALAPVRESGGLIQEFLAEIEEQGELSLIFLDGTFSHAVRKRPQRGDFRVQVEFGGASEAATPSASALALGRALLATVPLPCPYARVDVVETRRGPRLMELELIEPELFFRLAPDSATRLAQAILSYLRAAAPHAE